MLTAGNATRVDTEALRSMEGKIGELPLLPQVLVKVLQLSPDSDDYFEQFEKLAKEDPAFAVRVVALANSAASSPVVPITTIEDALTRMGVGTVSSLVASLSVQRVFMPRDPTQIRLWKHSIEAAVTTQRIAQLAPDLQVKPGKAYLIGLLHDIGRFVMLEHATPDLLRVDESNWRSPEELIEADMDVYKFTHSELGYLACRHWGLPDAIADVVRAHHKPIDEDIAPRSSVADIFCVQIADRTCISLLEHPNIDELTDENLQEQILLDCLRTEKEQMLLSASDLCDNLHDIRMESSKLLSGLGFAH